jgi:hypothetical protein
MVMSVSVSMAAAAMLVVVVVILVGVRHREPMSHRPDTGSMQTRPERFRN